LGALYVLEKLDPTDPAVAFEKLLTLFDQGYLQKSRDTCVSVMEIEVKTLDASALSPATEPGGRTYENPVARCLLKFAYNYLGCSTHGQWETALEHAKEVYDMYLSGWKTLDDPQSSSFLVSNS
jgi:hypothetical protein